MIALIYNAVVLSFLGAGRMAGETSLRSAIDPNDPRAAFQLLPLVYDELRKLAARKMAHEPAGQTLDATALVHEAYLRLIGDDPGKVWAGRAHFFAAAAEAMRRILVEKARAKHRLKRGGNFDRAPVEPDQVPAPEPEHWDELLAIDGALDRLAATDPTAAELVKLRYFAGFSLVEAAEILSVSPRTADRLWKYARAWLRRAVEAE
jgi:RNA polymerase sigma factor (TIGR02999 family)